MQTKYIPIFIGLLFICFKSTAQRVEFKEQIKKEFTVNSTTTLSVYNISGDIKIEGYKGNKILIEVDKTLSAKSKSALNKGKNEFSLKFEQKGDEVIVFISNPVDSRPRTNYNNWSNQDPVIYDYNLNFTIKVPENIMVVASTINDGEVKIDGMNSKIKANNINGGITLEDVKGAAEVHTINGDVDINYASVPTADSKYYTLNGKMTIYYPKNLKASCDYKSFNGELYTDFSDVKLLPAVVTQSSSSDKNKLKYQLNKKTKFDIGGGGPNLHFETFNGNIYIKKQS